MGAHDKPTPDSDGQSTDPVPLQADPGKARQGVAVVRADELRARTAAELIKRGDRTENRDRAVRRGSAIRIP